MSKIISIIIPVYNCDQHIEKCIGSIMNQDICCDNYELIVVDDGSTDNSLQIIYNKKKQYPFIKIVESNHRGLSAARNLGLKEAIGDYIFFIDADDWISSSTLSDLSNSIASHPCDIILFGINKVFPSGKARSLNYHLPKKDGVLTIENYIHQHVILSAAWQGIYSRDLLIKNDIKFPEGFLCEDDYFIIKLFSAANSVYILNKVIYYYYQRNDSISNCSNSEHNKKLIFDKLAILENLIPYIEQINEERKNALKKKLHYLTLDIIRLSIRKALAPDEISEILNRLIKSGYYPLKISEYKINHKPFCLLLTIPFCVRYYASHIFFRSFF